MIDIWFTIYQDILLLLSKFYHSIFIISLVCLFPSPCVMHELIITESYVFVCMGMHCIYMYM